MSIPPHVYDCWENQDWNRKNWNINNSNCVFACALTLAAAATIHMYISMKLSILVSFVTLMLWKEFLFLSRYELILKHMEKLCINQHGGFKEYEH